MIKNLYFSEDKKNTKTKIYNYLNFQLKNDIDNQYQTIAWNIAHSINVWAGDTLQRYKGTYQVWKVQKDLGMRHCRSDGRF